MNRLRDESALDPVGERGVQILRNVEGINFFEFGDKDVVRHPLVQKIVVAYDRSDKERKQPS